MKRLRKFNRVVLLSVFGVSVAFGVLGCRPSTSGISQTVKTSMQQTLDSDPQFRDLHLTVESVTVIRAGGNVYQGLARVKSSTDSHEVPVKITADGKNVMWQTEPGDFAPFAMDKMRHSLSQSTEDGGADSDVIYYLPGKAMSIVEMAYVFQAKVPEDLRHGHWSALRVPQPQAEAIAGDWAVLFVHYSLPDRNVDCVWRVMFPLADLQTQSHDALDGCAKTMFEPVEDTVPNSDQSQQ